MLDKATLIDEYLLDLEAALVKVRKYGNETDKWYVGIEATRTLLMVIGWCTSLDLYRFQYMIYTMAISEIKADDLLDMLMKYLQQWYVDLQTNRD